MNSANYVDNLVAKLKSEGKTKTEIVVASAEAELGWSYVWGAVGAQCNPSKRQAVVRGDGTQRTISAGTTFKVAGTYLCQ